MGATVQLTMFISWKMEANVFVDKIKMNGKKATRRIYTEFIGRY